LIHFSPKNKNAPISRGAVTSAQRHALEKQCLEEPPDQAEGKEEKEKQAGQTFVAF
jgi:hypothetical protein